MYINRWGIKIPALLYCYPSKTKGPEYLFLSLSILLFSIIDKAIMQHSDSHHLVEVNLHRYQLLLNLTLLPSLPKLMLQLPQSSWTLAHEISAAVNIIPLFYQLLPSFFQKIPFFPPLLSFLVPADLRRSQEHTDVHELLVHILLYLFLKLFASVDKGIHNKTTKYGLPTYWNYRPSETQGVFFIGRGRRYPYKRGLTAKSQALFSCHQIRRRKCEWPMKKQKS